MQPLNLSLYVITDEIISRGRSHEEIAELAISGGADVIQIRDKTCGCRKLTKIVRNLAVLANGTGTLLIVNDRLDVALVCGAHGVHLGQGDLRVDTARQLVPPGFIIGVSVGSAGEAEEAERNGADYVALSPVFDTRSKRDAGSGHGLVTLREVRRRVSIPVIAIGGINETNAADVIEAGADGIAVISAVVADPDIRAATKRLKDCIETTRKR